MKILVIENETALCETTVAHLKEEGYLCEQAGSIQKGSEKVYLYEYDCMLVDIGLPDGSGIVIGNLFQDDALNMYCSHQIRQYKVDTTLN